MPASVFEGRLALNRKPAWHGLGTIFDSPLSAVAACMLVGMDKVTYSKRPIAFYDEARGFVDVENRVALYRDSTDQTAEEFIDLVHPQYPVLTNLRLAEILDPLSKIRPVETAGLLGEDGSTVFYTLRDKPVDIGGDECGQYFVLVDYKKPGSALQLLETKVRIVCQNTLMAGISAATMKLSIPHQHGSFEADTEFYVKLNEMMRKSQDASTEVYRQMAKVKAPNVDAMLRYIWPNPTLPSKLALMQAVGDEVAALEGLSDRLATQRVRYDRSVERAKTGRFHIAELVERFNDEHPQSADTCWAVYNAAVEYADHRMGFLEADGPGHRGESALFGNRAKEKLRAFSVCDAPEPIIERVLAEMAG